MSVQREAAYSSGHDNFPNNMNKMLFFAGKVGATGGARKLFAAYYVLTGICKAAVRKWAFSDT